MAFLNTEKWNYDRITGINSALDADAETAFTDEVQNNLKNLEDGSWWFNYRAEVIIERMNQFFTKNKLTLDIGGGNGYTSSAAKEKGYDIGIIEPNPTACLHAKTRGIDEVYCGTVTNETILDESIAQALLLDVLEHIEDDEGFVNLLYRKIVQGGFLLVTVPAFMCLWSSEDDAAGHFRRYRMAALCDLLKKQGFNICYRSYYMGFLFLPIFVIRVLMEKIGILKRQEERSDEEKAEIARSQFQSKNGIVNIGLSVAEGAERWLMKKENRVSFGSSIIVVARKK